MLPDSGNGRRFEVHCSGAVANDLYQMQEGVASFQKQRIAAAFEKIVRDLQVKANEIGEPLYRLPHLHIQVRSTVVPPLGVVFGVCEDRPDAFIKTCKLLAIDAQKQKRIPNGERR
jgi:hypothetical protein